MQIGKSTIVSLGQDKHLGFVYLWPEDTETLGHLGVKVNLTAGVINNPLLLQRF